jgi:hypothetical protein
MLHKESIFFMEFRKNVTIIVSYFIIYGSTGRADKLVCPTFFSLPYDRHICYGGFLFLVLEPWVGLELFKFIELNGTFVVIRRVRQKPDGMLCEFPKTFMEVISN